MDTDGIFSVLLLPGRVQPHHLLMQPLQGSWRLSQQAELETGINTFESPINIRCVSACKDAQGEHTNPTQEGLQAWDQAQNLNTFSIAHIKRALTSLLTSFCFSIFFYTALKTPVQTLLSLLLSFHLIYSLSSPVSVFVYHRTTAPMS